MSHVDQIIGQVQSSLSSVDALPGPRLRFLNAADWLLEEYPPADAIIDPLFDRGTKCVVIGNSKGRKSFFVLQMAVSLAGGRDAFLRWGLPKTRKVLLCQLEIPEGHFHGRLTRMVESMGMIRQQLGGRLAVLNARGIPNLLEQDGFRSHIDAQDYDVIILDPLYKLLDGDENSAEAMKPTLAQVDAICEKTGASVVVAHHNPKGAPGDRQPIDRGAGSGVLARDYDAAIYLSPHQDDSLLVVETVARCYPPQEPFSVEWAGGHCRVSEIEPRVKTSSDVGKQKTKARVTDEQALAIVATAPMPKTAFLESLKDLGASVRGAKAVLESLVLSRRLVEWPEPRFQGRKLIGTPGQINTFKASHGPSPGQSSQT